MEVSSVATWKLEKELTPQREEFQHEVERLALDRNEKELNMQTRIDVSCHLLFLQMLLHLLTLSLQFRN